TRSRHALRILAEAAGTAHGYLYTCLGSEIALAAAVGGEDPPELLEFQIAELIARDPPSGDTCAFDLPGPLAEGGRFQLIALASADEPGRVVVALREGAEPLARIRAALLEE